MPFLDWLAQPIKDDTLRGLIIDVAARAAAIFSDAGFSPYQSTRLNGYDSVFCAYQPLVWRLFVRMVGIRPRGKQ